LSQIVRLNKMQIENVILKIGRQNGVKLNIKNKTKNFNVKN